jgi:hypothetical protein
VLETTDVMCVLMAKIDSANDRIQQMNTLGTHHVCSIDTHTQLLVILQS